MGQNIDTCITALLSGVGAGRNARRASLVHLYFNLIGTFLFMGVFYAVNAFVHFHFLSDAATGASVAIIHSIFNIVTTAVLLPLSGMIEKLAYLTIPVMDNESVDDKQEGSILDERFLERPAFAVAQCKSAVCEVAKLTEEAMALIHRSAISFQEEDISRVFPIEEMIDGKQDEVSAYLTKLSTKSLSEKGSRLVGKFGKCIVDFERISDYLKGIGYALEKMERKKEKFFKIISLKELIRKNHNKRLSKGKCSVALGIDRHCDIPGTDRRTLLEYRGRRNRGRDRPARTAPVCKEYQGEK